MGQAGAGTSMQSHLGRCEGLTDIRLRERLIDTQVILGHASCREAALEARAHTAPVDCRNSVYSAHRLVIRIHYEPGDAVFDQFRHRAAAEGDHWRATDHRLDDDEPKWLRPADRKEQRCGITEERCLLLLGYFADELDGFAIDQRPHLAVEISLIGSVDLSCDFQWHPGSTGQTDRRLRTF